MLKRWLDIVILLLAVGLPGLNGVARAHAAHGAHGPQGVCITHGPVAHLHIHGDSVHAHAVYSGATLHAARAEPAASPDDCDDCEGSCCCHDDCPFAHCVLALPAERVELTTPALLSFHRPPEPPAAPSTAATPPRLRPPIV
jgi:hypothetical protein